MLLLRHFSYEEFYTKKSGGQSELPFLSAARNENTEYLNTETVEHYTQQVFSERGNNRRPAWDFYQVYIWEYRWQNSFHERGYELATEIWDTFAGCSSRVTPTFTFSRSYSHCMRLKHVDTGRLHVYKKHRQNAQEVLSAEQDCFQMRRYIALHLRPLAAEEAHGVLQQFSARK